jgi:hypothetical protein
MYFLKRWGLKSRIALNNVPISQFPHLVKSATVHVVPDISQNTLLISFQIFSIKTALRKRIRILRQKIRFGRNSWSATWLMFVARWRCLKCFFVDGHKNTSRWRNGLCSTSILSVLYRNGTSILLRCLRKQITFILSCRCISERQGCLEKEFTRAGL